MKSLAGVRYAAPLIAAMLTLGLAHPAAAQRGGGDARRGPSATATQRQASVLFLLSRSSDLLFNRSILDGVGEVFSQEARPPVVYVEFVDEVRFDRAEYQTEFAQWLLKKYGVGWPDVIVATNRDVLLWLARYVARRPVLLALPGEAAVDIAQLVPTASAVAVENNERALMRVISTLLPDTRRIAVIHGSSAPERALADRVTAEIRATGFDVLDLGGLAMQEVLDRVAELPAGTVPVLLNFIVDRRGETVSSEERCTSIAAVSNRPLFALSRTLLGCGIVGGPLVDFKTLGRVMARETLSRLSGRPARTVRLQVADVAPLAFDGRQLVRWQLAEDSLPMGSEVLFREPSLWRDSRREVTGALGVGALLATLVVGLLVERRRRRTVQTALHVSYTQVKNLAHRLLTAGEGERRRLARELHDDLGQRLALLSLELNSLGRGDAELQSLQLRARDVARHAEEITREVQNLSHQLHPSKLETLGLRPSLKALCRELSISSGVRVDFVAGPNTWLIPPDVALALYRITQEALSNTIKYSGATRADVSLFCVEQTLRLWIVDAGCGFRVAGQAQGLGLVSMRERAELAGGRADVHSAIGIGTRIAVTIPLNRREARPIADRSQNADSIAS